MPKIQDKILAAQAKTAMIKFTKAMEQMALNNKIGPFYQDTEEFVAELGNYLKIAKVCKNDKLSDCFGYNEFTDATGKSISFDEIKDGSGFNLPKSSTQDFEGNTTGIVTIDGTPMVLAWNKKCEMLEPGVYTWSGNTNVSTKCVAAVMDVNGTKRPDKLGKDVILLNASNIGACIKFTVNGTTYKWGCPFEPQPINRTQCLELVNAGKILACAPESASHWTAYDGDRWAGTVKACGGTDKMPSMEDLAALAMYLFDKESGSIGEKQSYYAAINTSKLASLSTYLANEYANIRTITYSGDTGTKNLYGFSLWANEELSSGRYASSRAFCGTFTETHSYSRYRANELGICKL